MADLNPYAAPQSDPTPPSPVGVSRKHRAIAARMLELRGHDFSIALFYRWQAKLYAIRLIAFGGSLLFFASLNLWGQFLFMLGGLLGIMSQDYAWARSSARTWAVQRQVTDWEKVRQIADGESIALPQ